MVFVEVTKIDKTTDETRTISPFEVKDLEDEIKISIPVFQKKWHGNNLDAIFESGCTTYSVDQDDWIKAECQADDNRRLYMPMPDLSKILID